MTWLMNTFIPSVTTEFKLKEKIASSCFSLGFRDLGCTQRLIGKACFLWSLWNFILFQRMLLAHTCRKWKQKSIVFLVLNLKLLQYITLKMCCSLFVGFFSQTLAINLNYDVTTDIFFVNTDDGRTKWVLTADGWKFRERSWNGQWIWH